MTSRPLRQRGDVPAAAEAYLFKPATVASTPQPDDNGTPLQKDEPYADNPVEGVAIYYWLKGREQSGHARDSGCAARGGRDDPAAAAKGRARFPRVMASRGSRRYGRPRRRGRCRRPRGCIASCGRRSSPAATIPRRRREEQQPRVHTGVFTARLSVGGQELHAGFRGDAGDCGARSERNSCASSRLPGALTGVAVHCSYRREAI